jgi:hypothetical protein
MKKGFLFLLGVLFLLGTVAAPVHSQSYNFQVEKAEIYFFINPDGTAAVAYYLDFYNETWGSPIDFVDLGMPAGQDFDLGSAIATVDDIPLTNISVWSGNGITVGLGGNAIQPGKRGRVFIQVATIRKVLYDSDAPCAEKCVGFQFQPSYFRSVFVNGNTDMTVTLVLPTGMKESEPYYYSPSNWPGASKPYTNFDEQGRVYYQWQAGNATSSDQYVFGAAFPARLVPDSAIVRQPAIVINPDDLPIILMCVCFSGFLVWGIYEAFVGNKKRMLQYMPPKIAIEGNGIKRGLTAVEAAVLMEQPLDKVLTMILFAVIKKGAAQVASRDPLKIELLSPRPEDLRSYEISFLDAFADGKLSSQRVGLQTMMVALVRSVSENMRGFSRKETVSYYEGIMKKAWEQVEGAQTPEMKMQRFDEAMDWTMLDRDFNDRTRRVFTGPIILPRWYGGYDPAYRTPTTMASPGTPSQPITIPLPQLPGSDFAASIVNGITGFSAKVVGDVTGFTTSITKVTNPIPVSTYTSHSSGSSSSSGGGGRSCACACACACAGCACACAGGGR